jgi:hypothetical protein
MMIMKTRTKFLLTGALLSLAASSHGFPEVLQLLDISSLDQPIWLVLFYLNTIITHATG